MEEGSEKDGGLRKSIQRQKKVTIPKSKVFKEGNVKRGRMILREGTVFT